MFDYFAETLRSRVYEVAHETPLEHSTIISQELGNHIWLKREDMQPVFSFKLRGAYNCIAHHVAKRGGKSLKGVVTASAGNHSQGVAMSASKLGLASIIVMPVTTPKIKIESVRRLGGRIVLYGNTYDEAYDHAQKLLHKRKNYIYVHPYDDPWVICGQGTIASEIINQHPKKIDAIFVPVGGGGLLAGICTYIKHIQPSIKIIAVEPEDACAFFQSRQCNKRIKLKSVGLFADGVAVKQVGALNYKLCKDLVDDAIVVSIDEICAAIETLYNATRVIAEPSGALSLAGITRYLKLHPQLRNKHMINIVSGANVNFHKLRYISERIDYGNGQEKLLAITIPEKRGSFLKLARLLHRCDITEFNYRDNGTDNAHIFCGIRIPETKNGLVNLLSSIEKAGFATEDMTHNDLAKAHIRYTVGGRVVRKDVHESLFRLEFAEKPGALLQFLKDIPKEWNISLFHYRNHGSNMGQVLCGAQIQKGKISINTLKRLGYHAIDETDNPAYRLFLV